MTQQNQILAIEKGVKSQAEKTLTEAYHKLQRAELLTGLTRTYTPKDENGDKLPPERKLVQVLASDEVDRASAALSKLIDVVATKEATNTEASADIVVDGQTLATDIPVCALLFLEKQLVNVATFVSKLPILDPAERWTFQGDRNCFATEPVVQVRTQKLPRNHVKFDGDDKHPPQVEMYTEDVQIGRWATTKMSGALPVSDVNDMAERVDKLANAVKQARQRANMTDVTDLNIGAAIMGYIFPE